LRSSFPATVVAVRRFSARWLAATRKLVEDKANGPAVIQSLRHEIAGLVEVNPEGGKVSRAAAASPQLESGNWYLPHPCWPPGWRSSSASARHSPPAHMMTK